MNKIDKIIFYIGITFQPILIVASLIFYEVKWWQFMGMILVVFLSTALFLCYWHEDCYGFLRSQDAKDYYSAFYDWAALSFFGAFCFFCPVFDVW